MLTIRNNKPPTGAIRHNAKMASGDCDFPECLLTIAATARDTGLCASERAYMQF